MQAAKHNTCVPGCLCDVIAANSLEMRGAVYFIFCIITQNVLFIYSAVLFIFSNKE